jgi:hypothetical protein
MKMPNLTLMERERITDSMLKLQSARESLNQLEAGKIPAMQEINSCLKTADDSLRSALGYASPPARDISR